MKLIYQINKNDIDNNTTNNNNNNKTIRNVLLSHFHISHRLLITLKKNNSILLNNKPTYIDNKISLNDIITVDFDYEEDNSNIIPNKDISFDIIYEDDWMLIINKKAGMPVHPSILHYNDSLSNGIKYYYDTINLKKKIRPVNRIDKDTTGLVVFAKNEYIQEQLIHQMNENKFYKEYVAIVDEIFKEKKGIINLPISRKQGSIIERQIDDNGDIAITHYEVLKEINLGDDKNISVVKCILKTGRTHQIRVHMKYINHPLIGDDLYGNKSNLIKRQALHSNTISFIHPITKKKISFTAPLPDDMKNIIDITQKR